MKHLALTLIFVAAALTLARPPQADQPSLFGRWDLTVQTPKETYPSWIEIAGTEANPKVRIVGRVASVHPATNVKLEGGHLTFNSQEYFGKQIPVTWDLTFSDFPVKARDGRTHEFVLRGEVFKGTERRSDGVDGEITGQRAPALASSAQVTWAKPESLFDGKDLNGWQPDNPAKNHWTVESGELVNQAAGANIRTTRTFNDFKLHIEYNCPQDGNSGVYLRGRYEVQVEYEPADKNDKLHMMGSIYGFIAPAVAVPPRPGQWESYDIMLIGRAVTVVRDDVKIIDNQEIPGITGGALDSNEGAPGPIYIQGDHTGGMKYRNIKISVAQRSAAARSGPVSSR